MWLETPCIEKPRIERPYIEGPAGGCVAAQDDAVSRPPIPAKARTPRPKSSRTSADAEIEALYRKEAPALRLFVKRTLRGGADCEDIVQDAFVRTWRAVAEGGVRSPRAVLFKTARNLALNHIRNCRARTSDATRAALIDVFARPVATAEEEVIASEQAEGCRRLLEGLPHRCREAFVLRVVDELSYHDMAEVMRLSISTIEKHVGKGKQICRARLEAADHEGDPMIDAILSSVPRRSGGWQSAGDLLFAAE